MKTQPVSASQHTQEGYDPGATQAIDELSVAPDASATVDGCPTADDGGEADAGNTAAVGGSAGVITGGVPSRAASQVNAAGVIAGGIDVLGLRLAHTRYPWLDDFMFPMAGHRKDGRGRALFDVSDLTEVAVPDGEDRFVYFVDIFFQKRYYAKHREMRYDPLVRSSPDSLAEAWNEFVISMVKNHDGWMSMLDNLKRGFMSRHITGYKIRVHQLSVQEAVPCCVLREQACPMCYATSLKATKALRKNEYGQISRDLHAAIKCLDSKWQHHAAVLERERMRSRAAQEDVLDDIPLAQVEPLKTLQRLRDMETQLCFVQQSSDQLTASVQTLIKDGSDFRSELSSLEHSLTETQKKLYQDGVFQRPRYS